MEKHITEQLIWPDEMQDKKKSIKYKIEGNHPVLRRIDWIAKDQKDLESKLDELKLVGYEVDVSEIKTNKKLNCIEQFIVWAGDHEMCLDQYWNSDIENPFLNSDTKFAYEIWMESRKQLITQ